MGNTGTSQNSRIVQTASYRVLRVYRILFPEIILFVDSLNVEGRVLEQEQLSDVMVYLGSASRLRKMFFSAVDNETLHDTVSFEDMSTVENRLKKIQLKNLYL